MIRVPGRHDPLADFRGRCKTCKADILWAVTERGELMPVNVKPTTAGNVVLTITDDSPTPFLEAGVLSRGQAAGARDRGIRLHTSHFQDCPNATGHRRRSRRP